MSHLLTELGLDLFDRHLGVFDRVVQQAGDDGGGVEAHFRQYCGHFQRMNQVGLAGGARLAGVVLERKLVGFFDQGEVVVGAVAADFAQ